MTLTTLAPIRSWLYVPGNRPDRIAKAFTLAADAVIRDFTELRQLTRGIQR